MLKSKLSRLFKYLIYLLIFLWIVIPIFGMNEYSEIIRGTLPRSYNSRADCGVVLTGGPGRIREGLALMSRRQIKRLIISGVHQHSTLMDMIPEVVFSPEIDLEKVILERRSNSTAGNAQQSLALVEALSCKSILLITSDYHMNRALQTFEHVFPPVVTIIPYVVPSDRTQGLKLWVTTFDEFYKYVFYRVFIF